ncbi:MAG: plasma-membrane proton-efflux P-type ATPase [Bacteroidales bacterium]
MTRDNRKKNSERIHPGKVLKEMDVNPDNGLSSNEAARRKEEYGANEIVAEKKNPLLQFLSYFWGPIPWMIETAVILSAIAGRWEDFAVILLMLLINGGVGYWHESKASNAIDALKEKLSPDTIVIRNGTRKKMSAKELVPGDIILLKIGKIIPADAIMLKDEHISADESSLTGESLPVDKGGGDRVYSGTVIKRGEAKAVVIATGHHTKFARTVELVEEAEEKSHFQKAVLRIGYFLIGVTAVLVSAIIIAGILREEKLMDVLLFAMVITIAGIPQALPAVMSFTMTIGARRLAKKKAIVSRLSAMEEMAGLKVLCADKTGTLTMNKLTVQEPVLFDADDKEDILRAAALTLQEDDEDPIDKAIRETLKGENITDNYEVKSFHPFDPTRKRAEAVVEHDGKKITVAKGAPQVILGLCDMPQEKAEDISSRIDELGEKGLRSLGVARRDNGQWLYLGLLPLLDPPRDDSRELIKEAVNVGIDIRMVTGDHKAIARQVCVQLDLNQDIISADEFFEQSKEENRGDEEKEKRSRQLNDKFLKAGGFAEVTPEHKFSIIKKFQSNGDIVGMTGDGVNDAPALKQADVGIAVSESSDAARSAAALVLTEQGLGVIIHAIREARRIFERMTEYATFRITESMRVLLFMSLAILVFGFYPVTPIMVVLLAILNDIPIMTIACDNVPVAKNPVRWQMDRVLTIASVLSAGGVITSFILFWFIFHNLGWEKEVVQTMIFLKLLVAGHMTIYLTRNAGWFWEKPYPAWIFFIAVEATQVAGTLFAVYGILVHPIGWAKAGIVWAFSIVSMLIMSVVKVATIKILGKKKKAFYK